MTHNQKIIRSFAAAGMIWLLLSGALLDFFATGNIPGTSFNIPTSVMILGCSAGIVIIITLFVEHSYADYHQHKALQAKRQK